MKRTVHISTFCVSDSYGSVLQTLGLKRALEKLGYCSRIEQIGVGVRNCPDMKVRKCSARDILMVLLKFLVYPKLLRKYRSISRFIEENIDIAYYQDLEQMQNALKKETLFLAGSDQIWNPLVKEPQYYLEHAPSEAGKLTYAVSLGVSQFPKELDPRYLERIRRFDRISVREADAAAILAPYVDQKIQVHIDPSFLCTGEEWRCMEKEYPMGEAYILVYPLYWDQKWNRLLKEIHVRTGKKIVVIGDYIRSIYANKWLFDVDMGQFLWLIDHADAVVSSSFHGVAMAVNFNRPVLPLVNPDAPSRIRNLMELLCVPEVTVEMLEKGADVDYTPVNRTIEKERQRAYTFLKEMLEA